MRSPEEYEAEIDRLSAALDLEARLRCALAEACADREFEMEKLKRQLRHAEQDAANLRQLARGGAV